MRPTLTRFLPIGVFVFGLLLPGARASGANPTRPNLVLFVADDLSWESVSIHGARDIQTPYLDRLASDGMMATHAFVASPSCAPSRGAFLTGLSPVRNGAMFNHQAPRKSVKKWPAYFQELGYEVVAIGKVAHYAQVTQYGFDFASHYTYHDDVCVEAAAQWLAGRKSDKPLCLIVGTNWPHVPWPTVATLDPAKANLPPTQVDTPETRAAWARYAAAVANADHDLGRIYSLACERLGADTLFAFTSDHGAQFPFHKWNCYDGGLRVPMIVVWPGHIAPGSHTDAMVSLLDLLPTFLEAAGGTPPSAGTSAGEIDGRSLLGVLRGERATHHEAIFATHSGDGRMNFYPTRAVRTRRWKYIRNLDPTLEFHSHVDLAPGDTGYWPSWAAKAEHDATARAMVEHYIRRPAEELFDLDADPFEQRNLATDPAHTATLAAMRAKLDGWMAERGDRGIATDRAVRPPLPPAKS